VKARSLAGDERALRLIFSRSNKYNEDMRTFEYRLYPNRTQRRHLMACLIESRGIYNAMLEALKAQYETNGTFPRSTT
jgi:hypothetical protein